MNQILLLTGFFLPTFLSTAVDHWIKQPGFSELVDSAFTAAVFTAVFAISLQMSLRLRRRTSHNKSCRPKGTVPSLAGACLRALPFLLPLTPKNALTVGFGAGTAAQLAIWSFWLLVPHNVRYTFGFWPVLLHLTLMVAAGQAVFLLCERSRLSV